MDLILRNARLIGAEQDTADIGIMDGKIAAIEPKLAAEGETIDLGGRLVSSGLIETHIHLDKSRIAGRCPLIRSPSQPKTAPPNPLCRHPPAPQ